MPMEGQDTKERLDTRTMLLQPAPAEAVQEARVGRLSRLMPPAPAYAASTLFSAVRIRFSETE